MTDRTDRELPDTISAAKALAIVHEAQGTIHSYEPISHGALVMAELPHDRPQRWVTWRIDRTRGVPSAGHYFDTRLAAQLDFLARLAQEPPLRQSALLDSISNRAAFLVQHEIDLYTEGETTDIVTRRDLAACRTFIARHLERTT